MVKQLEGYPSGYNIIDNSEGDAIQEKCAYDTSEGIEQFLKDNVQPNSELEINLREKIIKLKFENRELSDEKILQALNEKKADLKSFCTASVVVNEGETDLKMKNLQG